MTLITRVFIKHEAFGSIHCPSYNLIIYLFFYDYLWHGTVYLVIIDFLKVFLNKIVEII